MVRFSENFWGEKCLGFDVLYHNMKHGQKSCSEFIEFVKERMLVEENYSKQLGKLSTKVGAYPQQGTFAPYWQVLKASTEKNSNLHQQMVTRLQDLLKELQKYLDEQTRKHKTMKDAENDTLTVVQSIQSVTGSLHKAKEAYLTRSVELEKCRKDNAGPRDVERAETRLKKAMEEYRSQLDKYAATRGDFERKMLNTCQHFQDLEEQHLQQMLEFATGYNKVLDYCADNLREICNELRQQTGDLTIERLLQIFVEAKSTGTDRPAPIEFEEAPSSGAPSQPPPLIPPPVPTTASLLDFDGDSSFGFGFPPPAAPAPLPPPLVMEEVAAPPPPKKREGILRSQYEKSSTTQPASKWHRLGRSSRHEPLSNGDAGAADGRRSVPVDVAADRWPVDHEAEDRDKENGIVEQRRKFSSLRNLFSSKSNEAGEPKSSSSAHSDLTPTNVSSAEDNDLARNTVRGSKWFLRARRDKTETKKDKDAKKEAKKEAKKKKDKNGPNNAAMAVPTAAGEDAKSESSFGSTSHDGPPAGGGHHAPMVDAEGFMIRPSEDDVRKVRKDSFEQFREESTTDSESEDDKPQKLHVVIKPATLQPNHTGPVGSTDELRQQAKSLMLGNLGHSYTGGKRATTKMQEMMKRSTSVASNMFPPPPSPSSASLVDAAASGGPPIPPQKTGGSVASNPWDSTPDFSAFSAAPVAPVVPISRGISILPPPLSVAPPLAAAPTVAIPVAVAFVEKVSAAFIGAEEARCRVRIEGDLILTFPSGVLQTLLANPHHPPLSFALTQTSLLENILPNRHLVSQETQIDDGRITYTVNMLNLVSQLKKQVEAKAQPQPYQNIPVMKYHVSGTGAAAAPISLIAYWKEEERTTDMRIDYRRSAAYPSFHAAPCQLSVPFQPDVEVTSMTSVPAGDWTPGGPLPSAKWSVPAPTAELSSIKARFEHPPESRGRVKGAVQCAFAAEGTLLSRAAFQLLGAGFKVSVVKMRVASARYVCEVG
ncbi:F-BAR domain only protein 2-like isoform X1 [Paramacrobiotus metropolitanus]|uniref:F-BAR domain only protein 2-like isoform X1 n=1 Tax=Paramacrobiotus metropolitanus TaxID=2943436 RepID=UPI0024463FE3|nr:F-BAR domain only protein 2-like isoform X1 [Paramacrobiotus metropolitanus]